MKSFLYIVIFLVSLSAQAITLEPGLYEYVIQNQMTGGPALPPQAQAALKKQTHKHCVGKDQKTEGFVGEITKGTNCTVGDLKEVGNTISWKTTCQGSATVNGKGKMTFTKNSFNGENITDTIVPGMKITIKTTYTGKRISACK